MGKQRGKVGAVVGERGGVIMVGVGAQVSGLWASLASSVFTAVPTWSHTQTVMGILP